MNEFKDPLITLKKNIQNKIILEDVASKASMSLSNFYRIFFALAGYSVKEYIKLRRISFAAHDLQDGTKRISDIAKKYSYNSADSFSRTFKRVTGSLPSEYRNSPNHFSFEKIDLYDKYYAKQDQDLLTKYPDIKVLKSLDPFSVASYTAFSHTPEMDAFRTVKEWAAKDGLLSGDGNSRIFGFDSSNSLQKDGRYGYEAWITVPDDYVVHDDRIVLKKCSGGLYAVTSTTIGDIVSSWNRFREWLKLSRYEMGDHQCLEEHLPFEDWEDYQPQQDMKIDLYMPLQQNPERIREIIHPIRVTFYRSEGYDGEKMQ